MDIEISATGQRHAHEFDDSEYEFCGGKVVFGA